MWVIGGYIKTADPAGHPNTSGILTPGGTAAVVFFYLWTACYTPSWNGTPWVVNSEMFGQEDVRSLGQASAAASNWFWNFVVSRFTPVMFLAMDTYGVYMFFAALMAVSVGFVFFCVPETRGVPLEGMGRLFGVWPVWRANGVVIGVMRAREGGGDGKVGVREVEGVSWQGIGENMV